METSFSFTEQSLLATSLLSLLFSIYFFFYTKQHNLSLALLLLGGFLLRLFFAYLDPFLHLWDEQFHALVAKNMIDNPLHPMLYKDTLLDSGTHYWIDSHTWLHKQPLFLWQMALSIKLFGTSALAVRLPSIILSTIVIGFIYKIGKIVVNRNTAYFAAIIFACSFYSLELSAGGISTDHNDIAFLFYVTASFWAWFEYQSTGLKKKKIGFIVLIGLFSGGAILVKWLVGLLVYIGWGISILAINENRTKIKSYVHLIISLLITVITFIPWQIYILNKFPVLSRYEYQLNTAHFFQVIEDHYGTWNYHFIQTNNIYGFTIYLMMVFFIVLIFNIKNNNYKVFIATCIITIYIFFTFAATKMISFTFVIASLGFLAIGNTLHSVFNFTTIKEKYDTKGLLSKTIQGIILIVVLFNLLNFEKIKRDHKENRQLENNLNNKKTNNTRLLLSLNTELKDIKKTILFNTNNYDNIQAMYFTEISAAYSRIPTKIELKKCFSDGYTVVVMDNNILPKYILADSNIVLINGYLF